MSWNDGYERRKFEAKQKKLAEEYRKAGMTEEQIKAMYEFDFEQFKSDRKYRMHTQPFASSDFEEGDDDDSESTLLEKFEEQITVRLDDATCHSRYWWIEEIENPKIAQQLKKLSCDDIELLTKRVIDGFNQAELAKEYNISQKNISKKLARIKKFLLQGV